MTVASMGHDPHIYHFVRIPPPLPPRTWYNDMAGPRGIDPPLASGKSVRLEVSIFFTFSDVEPLCKKSGCHCREATIQDDMESPCKERKVLRLI